MAGLVNRTAEAPAEISLNSVRTPGMGIVQGDEGRHELIEG